MTTEATTSAQIEALLIDDHLAVTYGLEVLDSSDVLVEDISDAFKGGTIEHHNDATVHGTATLTISEARSWTTERLRPYQTLTSGTYHKTWYLGVYLPAVPDIEYGDDPVTYEVSCFDKLSLLDRPVGDTYTVVATTKYLAAVAAAITAAGVTGLGYLFDETAIDTAVATDMVWFLDPDQPETWLNVCNDLLRGVGYNNLWVDSLGYFRSEPVTSASVRPSVWTFDLSLTSTQIVEQSRRFIQDEYNRTNSYRFVRTGMTVRPVEGAGLYTVAVGDGYQGLNGTVTTDGLYTVHKFTSSGTLEWTGADTEVEFLVAGAGAGGGGAGGNGGGGGGGGGEVLVGTTVLQAGDITVTIGGGGTPGASTPTSGGVGGDTVFGAITAKGGGLGGVGSASASADGGASVNGGGAGGGDTAKTGGATTGGGYAGGNSATYAGGGGAGMGAAGENGSATDAGDGGGGIASDILVTSSNVYYGGGGGGGLLSNRSGAAGTGGTGGGGGGGKGANGTAGTANTGGGGGGGGRDVGVANKAGGTGGSGIVVIRYLTPTTRRQVIAYDAVDQTTLETLGNAYIEQATKRKQTMSISTGPLPLLGHNQVVQYTDADAGIAGTCAVSSWTLDVTGLPVNLELEVIS